MQVTEKMVRAACDVYDSAPEADGADTAMRAALETALSAMWRPMSEAPNAMWLALAQQIELTVFKRASEGRPEDALRWAACAEACFWKATGEAKSHDFDDVVAMAKEA